MGENQGESPPRTEPPEPRHGARRSAHDRGGVLLYPKGPMMRRGLEYLNIAEKCRSLASQATESRVKKKLESMARSLETLAARRAKQLDKLPKAPRVRSR